MMVEEAQEIKRLHQNVWMGDLNQVKNIISKGNHSIINGKYRGKTPLTLACELGHLEIVDILLVEDADTLLTSQDGYYPLQEATSFGNRELIRKVLIKRHEQIRRMWLIHQPFLYNALINEVPDFYIELLWKFNSFIPFLSMACPSDVCRIWKKGPHIRVDTTLMGFENWSWKRGNITYLFTVGQKESFFHLMDHDRKLVEEVDKMKDFTENEITEDINMRLNTEIYSGKIVNTPGTDKIKFSRQKSGLFGFGSDRDDVISDYLCHVYNVENVALITRNRKEHLDARKNDCESLSSLKSHMESNENHVKDYDSNSCLQSSTFASSVEIRHERKEMKRNESISFASSRLDTENGGAEAKDDKGKFNNHKVGIDNGNKSISSTDSPPTQEHVENLLGEAKNLMYTFMPSLNPPKNETCINYKDYFEEDEEGKPRDKDEKLEMDMELKGKENSLINDNHIHIGRKLHIDEKIKKLKLSLWMADDFPLKLQHLLPIFEVLSPTSEHFEKLNQFINMDLPPGFPIQIEIPIFSFLSTLVTFQNYRQWNVGNKKEGKNEINKYIPNPSFTKEDANERGEDWFKVRKDYKEGVVIKNIFKRYEND